MLVLSIMSSNRPRTRYIRIDDIENMEFKDLTKDKWDKLKEMIIIIIHECAKQDKQFRNLAGFTLGTGGALLGIGGYQAYEAVKRKKKRQEAGRKAASTRRKRKSRFGKKAKKPSAALRRLCKKHKVRLTVKRGNKRVYKYEKVLKKQCKKAMKKK